MSSKLPLKFPQEKNPTTSFVGGSESFSKKRFLESVKHWTTEFVAGRLPLIKYGDMLMDDAETYCYQTGRGKEVEEAHQSMEMDAGPERGEFERPSDDEIGEDTDDFME